MENPRYLKVEGYSNLVRDTNTNAIINTDSRGHKSYVNLKISKQKEKERIDQIESDLSDLKNDVNDIKNLLIKLSEKF